MTLLPTATATCPHCGEAVEFEFDPTAGRNQVWIEDCWVCCRPMQVRAERTAEGRVRVRVQRA